MQFYRFFFIFPKNVIPRYKAVLGDDSFNHDSDGKRKSKFESITKLSSYSVFHTTLLMFKCPPRNHFGFICLSRKTLAWFTGWKNLNLLLIAVILRCSLHVQSLRLKITFCVVALEIINGLSFAWCTSIKINTTITNIQLYPTASFVQHCKLALERHLREELWSSGSSPGQKLVYWLFHYSRSQNMQFDDSTDWK